MTIDPLPSTRSQPTSSHPWPGSTSRDARENVGAPGVAGTPNAVASAVPHADHPDRFSARSRNEYVVPFGMFCRAYRTSAAPG